MSRGPGKWQRVILTRLQDEEGFLLLDCLCDSLDRSPRRTEYSAMFRAAVLLARRSVAPSASAYWAFAFAWVINRHSSPRCVTRITVGLAITPADRNVVLGAEFGFCRALPCDVRHPALADFILTVLTRLLTRLACNAATLRPLLSCGQRRLKPEKKRPTQKERCDVLKHWPISHEVFARGG
jgi:hypothetical protein